MYYNMKKNKNFSDTDFTAIIHTLQMKSSEALLPEDEIIQKPYVRGFHISGGKATYRVNPNRYGETISSLANFEETMEHIFDELEINEYQIVRLDVAINSPEPYERFYKINNYIKELYSTYLNENNSYLTMGADLKKRSLKVTNRNFELEIYDKDQESKGKDPAKTRIEFRYKRLHKNQSPEDVLKSVCRVLDALPNYISELNKKKIDQLYAEYLKENEKNYEGRVTSLPSFVSKYADFIYNTDIMNGLYGKCHTGKCKNWLYRYRASGKTLTLYTKGDLVSYLKLIKTAVKNYANGNSI